jgi:hypothetical protein
MMHSTVPVVIPVPVGIHPDTLHARSTGLAPDSILQQDGQFVLASNNLTHFVRVISLV